MPDITQWHGWHDNDDDDDINDDDDDDHIIWILLP